MLLAPCVVLTQDRHLLRSGIGEADWLRTVLLLGELATLDETVWGSSRAAWLSVYLPGLALARLGRLIASSELALAIALALGVGAAVYGRPRLRSAAEGAWARVEPVLQLLGEAAVRGLEHRSRTEEALAARRVIPAAATAESAVARMLAEHWEPLPTERIRSRLRTQGHDLSLAATRKLLRGHPSFVGLPGKGYQLGHSLSEEHPPATRERAEALR
jgi:hypothetical protein